MLKVPEFRFTPTPYHQAKALDKLSAMGTVVVEPPHRQMMTDAQLEVFYLPAGSVTAGAFVPNIVAMQRFWTKRLMGKLGERAVFIDERGMNFDDTMVSERVFFVFASDDDDVCLVIVVATVVFVAVAVVFVAEAVVVVIVAADADADADGGGDALCSSAAAAAILTKSSNIFLADTFCTY